jgi:hypothetical protein
MPIQATITLGQLHRAFVANDFNFLCFAAECIVEQSPHVVTPVQADSLTMWRALYKLDSELFIAPPNNPTQEEMYRDALVLNYWMNPELAEQYTFVKELGSRTHHGNSRRNRFALLALLMERHGTEALLDLEFVEV